MPENSTSAAAVQKGRFQETYINLYREKSEKLYELIVKVEKRIKQKEKTFDFNKSIKAELSKIKTKPQFDFYLGGNCLKK